MPVSFTTPASVMCGNAFRMSLLGRTLFGTAKPMPATQTVSSANGRKAGGVGPAAERRRHRAAGGEVARHIVARHAAARAGGGDAGERRGVEAGLLRELERARGPLDFGFRRPDTGKCSAGTGCSGRRRFPGQPVVRRSTLSGIRFPVSGFLDFQMLQTVIRGLDSQERRP